MENNITKLGVLHTPFLLKPYKNALFCVLQPNTLVLKVKKTLKKP